MNRDVKEEVVMSVNPQEVPRRIALFPQKTPVKFEAEKPEEKLVMTFPNLIIREVICFQVVVIVCAVLALFFNAPLEELANPQNTPNPAKAPWYFLGLQELLHNFPPVVAGVLIPLLIVLALVVIPYFNINIKREGLWVRDKKRTLILFSSGSFLFIVATLIYSAYSIVIPTFIIYCLALLPLLIKRQTRFINWLSKRSLAEWIMSWFAILATVLTIIGTYFRGPGWSWVWPW
jgi:quinol-cytochrome oxidoreductase complex cytochrome b subunit